MANDLTVVIPRLLAQGLLALRQQAVMPQLINRGYETIAGQKGSTIDVPIPAAVAVQDVTPANTPPSTADVVPTSVSIPLDQWKEAPFYMTDKDLQEAMDGTIPMQASEAIKAIANTVDSFIMTRMKLLTYGYTGLAGTTPFGAAPANLDLSDAVNVRTILNQQLAPMDDRRMVLDPLAEGKALTQRAIQDASWRQNQEGIVQGRIGTILGFDWYMDQNVAVHTTGTLSNGSTHTALISGSPALGATTISISSATLTGTVVPGDIFTVAGDNQTYVVTNATTLTAAANALAGITFSPPAKTAFATSAVITFKATHTVNLAFHRDAFAFATRPLDSAMAQQLGSMVQSAVDPVSGLTLRLEVTREHKRNRWSYDILYGGKLVRPDFACRLAG